VAFLATFFLGDSRVFGDFGDLAFGDSLFFFGDLVVLAFAALAFLGDVASFLGLDVVVVGFFVAGAFFVVAFFGDEVVDFLTVLGLVVDLLVGVIDVFFELDVDLFLGDDGAVNEDPDVDCVEVVVDFFLPLVDFFFFFLSA